MLSRRILTVGLLSLPFKSSIASNKVEDHYKTLNLLENYNNYKVKVTGGDINIATFGNKNLPPIILLHKLGGRIEEWRRLIPKLIEYRYVIAMDLPGHGLSNNFSDPPFIVTQEELASKVMSVVDSIELTEPVSFLGSSLGGCVSLVCAHLWPDRVSSVYTVGSAFNGLSSISTLQKESIKSINNGQFDENEFPIKRELTYARDIFGVYNKEIALEMNLSREQAGNWLQPIARGVGRFNYLSILTSIQNKVYLYHGTRGNYGKFHKVAHKLLPNSFMRSITNSGAFPHEEASDRFWGYLINDLA